MEKSSSERRDSEGESLRRGGEDLKEEEDEGEDEDNDDDDDDDDDEDEDEDEDEEEEEEEDDDDDEDEEDVSAVANSDEQKRKQLNAHARAIALFALYTVYNGGSGFCASGFLVLCSEFGVRGFEIRELGVGAGVAAVRDSPDHRWHSIDSLVRDTSLTLEDQTICVCHIVSRLFVEWSLIWPRVNTVEWRVAADVIFARLMSLMESGAYLAGATQFARVRLMAAER
uniref:Uncharacterized protein n=1 Tax=Vespula pensylvanica TaxID=30213 RepID=A0A834NEB9_VESPE|nr:hypothetical protein H0235_014636 [Vespula pensylvanica]